MTVTEKYIYAIIGLLSIVVIWGQLDRDLVSIDYNYVHRNDPDQKTIAPDRMELLKGFEQKDQKKIDK